MVGGKYGFAALAWACFAVAAGSSAVAQNKVIVTAVRADQAEFVIREGMDAGFEGRVDVHLSGGLCVGSDNPTEMTIRTLTLFESVSARVVNGEQGKVLVNANRTHFLDTRRAEELAAGIQAAAGKGVAAFGADRSIGWYFGNASEDEARLSSKPVAVLHVRQDNPPAMAVLKGCYTLKELGALRSKLTKAAAAIAPDLKLPRIDPR